MGFVGSFMNGLRTAAKPSDKAPPTARSLFGIVPVQLLTKTARMPIYATAGAAGMDLHADNDHPIYLMPGDRTLIPTGISIALPVYLEAQIRPRSGLARNNGVTVLNSPGTIDSDYRGEIGVILYNTSKDPVDTFVIRRGDRIAQMVIAPIVHPLLVEVEKLAETKRGVGGFGSTGVSREREAMPIAAMNTTKEIEELIDGIIQDKMRPKMQVQYFPVGR